MTVQEIVDRLRGLEKQADATAEELSCLIVRDGAARFAFPVEYLVETLQPSRKGVVRIPLCEEYIAGVVNVRGEMLPVLCISKMIGIPGGETRFLVVVRDDFPLAFAFEELLELASVPVAGIRPLVNLEAREQDAFLREEFDYEGEVVRLVDVPALFTSSLVR
jgi:chemotaxis signal transduction protein